MGVASSSFKLKGDGDDADGEDAALSAGLCNDRCRASPRATAHAGSDEDHALFARELFNIMGVSAGVRRFGSAALDLAYVAAGRFDGYWEHGLKSWDIAAGILLVREAGGFVSDFASRDRVLQSGDVVAGNPAIHAELLKHLAKARA